MAITYVKDIPDFTTKVKQITDITELKTTVDQLSASMLEVQGDVTELETTVGQLSASMLEVQGDVSTLAGAVTALDGEIDGIKARVEKNLAEGEYYSTYVGTLFAAFGEEKNGVVRIQIAASLKVTTASSGWKDIFRLPADISKPVSSVDTYTIQNDGTVLQFSIDSTTGYIRINSNKATTANLISLSLVYIV